MPKDSLSRSRLDSFSDGVIAVIITIMVLEMKVPAVHDMGTRDALRMAAGSLAIYLLSFIQTGIYWVNHHYMMDDVEHVTHGILWANLALLFCLSLIPFGTEWIGVRGVAPAPVAVYAVCFGLPAIAWAVLAALVCKHTGKQPAAGPLRQYLSIAINLVAIGIAFVSPWASIILIAGIAIRWLLPPRAVAEKMYGQRKTRSGETR